MPDLPSFLTCFVPLFHLLREGHRSDEDGGGACEALDTRRKLHEHKAISAYEKERLKNIARNKAKLVSLGLAKPSDTKQYKKKVSDRTPSNRRKNLECVIQVSNNCEFRTITTV